MVSSDRNHTMAVLVNGLSSYTLPGTLPKKARRGHPLTVLEKIYNRAMSALRIAVEHAIGHLKKYRMLAGVYRGEAERYDESASVIAGLHNYRELGKLSW